MDVEQLHVVLQQSFSPDASLRTPAEETIRNLKHIPGATSMLLQVAAEKQVRYEVRQAAAIQLKNICRECWAERINFAAGAAAAATGETTTTAAGTAVADAPAAAAVASSRKTTLLSLEDKALIRPGLINALLDEPEKSVRDLFAETLHSILIHDFPTSWPELVPTLLTTIQNGVQDPNNQGLRVHNALVALRKVCKRYEYKSKEQRGPLNDIVIQSFPLLLPLAQRLSIPEEHSLEAAMMLKQILKIFWSSTQFYLPAVNNSSENTNGNTEQQQSSPASPALASPQSMQPWFDILWVSLTKPLPEASTGEEPRNQPTTIEERNAWPWWKVKKWSVQIMSRLFSRYGMPSYADEDSKEFAHYFSQNVATQFLGPVCETLNLRPAGKFCTDRVVHLCLTYVDLAVELSSTYKLLKPHLEFLLYQVCFPTMCLTADDIDVFENEPHEFVHRQNSPLADFYDPRMSAITLVTDLVKHRGQDVTANLLGKMTEILHRYNQQYNNPTAQQHLTQLVQQQQQQSQQQHGESTIKNLEGIKDHIEKDGALLTFGSLAKFLLQKEKYAKEIEGLLVTSVFSDFNSPIAFLRFRACWMVQQFHQVKWSDDGTNRKNLTHLILQRLSDPALPVQIEASKALRFLIEAHDSDGPPDELLPVLPQLLTEYFRIMNEIGNDEVVSALQVLLDKFGDHIEPHAVALVSQLSGAFTQYCSAGEDEDDDDAAMAAAQCLECIATVLKGVCDQQSILKALEPQLIPLILKVMSNDGEYIEYLECALDILTFLTYFQEQVSVELWQAFPLIYNAFDQWAYDYLNMMVPCLQSYICKAPDVFLAGQAQLPEGTASYIDLIMSMVAKTVTNDRASESECRYALSLFMSILHNCMGRIDQYIPFINEVTLGKLGQQVQAEIPLTRISIYQVLGSALYYNPALELMELEKRSVTQQVLVQWIQDTPHMDRWLPRKLSVLGLSAILALPTSTLPQTIATSIPQLIDTVVRMTLALKADSEKGQNIEGMDGAKKSNGMDGAALAAAAAGGGGAAAAAAAAAAAGAGGAETPADAAKAAAAGNDVVADLDKGFGEDEDVTNEVDEAYRKALQGVTSWDDDMAKFLLGIDWDEDSEDVDEDYTSPIDKVEELLFLSDTLNAAFQREPEVYKQIQAALPPESVANCQKLFAAAESLRAQAAQQSSQQS